MTTPVNSLNITASGLVKFDGTSTFTSTTTTQYNVLVGNTSNAITNVAPSATTGIPLVSQGSSANPTFSTAAVAGGGTGITTTTAYAPICAGTTATGNFQQATTGFSTSGYVLTSNGSSALPTWQAPSGGGITWSEVTGTSQNMAINSAYIANNAGLVTLTLPSTAAIGSIVWIVGKGAGLWKIAQNSGQTIHFGSQNTTTGVGGSLTATNQYDAIQLLCTIANTDWTCTGIAQGNITVV